MASLLNHDSIISQWDLNFHGPEPLWNPHGILAGYAKWNPNSISEKPGWNLHGISVKSPQIPEESIRNLNGDSEQSLWNPQYRF